MNMTDTAQHSYSVVSFAYNEGDSINATIRSIISNSDKRLKNITIVANGCTDNTAEIAKETLNKYAPCSFKVVQLEIGDKCNAWNHYIYHHLAECEVVFFTDSDLTFSENAFPKLFDKLLATNQLAIAGLPQTGRNIAQYVELVENYSCLFGGLYGVKQQFLTRLKNENIYLPMGLNWIDSQITKLINHNLSTDKSIYTHQVTFEPNIGYHFESLKPWKPSHIKLYLNRLVRYKTGQLQESYLDNLPFREWPKTMANINACILSKGISTSSLGKLFFLKPLIIKRLKKGLKIKPTLTENN